MASQQRERAAWRTGSDAHYLDPAYYTATYARRTHDVAYYVDLATEHGGPVLEYGCGNGRILLPLARAGVTVAGVDHGRVMLDDLRASLRREPPEVRRRVSVRRGDMRKLRLRRRFPLVLSTFNTFLHLYTRRDVEQHLACVRAHLTAGGRFVLDVSIPDPDELCRDPSRAYHVPRFRHATTGEVVRYSERFAYETRAQVLTVHMQFEPLPARGRDEASRPWSTPLCHRQFFPQEIEALLHYNGLRVVDAHDLDDDDDGSMVLHCALRPSWRKG